jgi:glycosyltransferase involved in cell wall biosynthesis
MYNQKKVAVIIPAYNEALSIHQVIHSLFQLKNSDGSKIIDELVVCDNNSSDQTATIAKQAGATLVSEPIQGYGIACLTALSVLQSPNIVVFVDADGAVKSTDLPCLLHAISKGYDLVIGSRTLGQPEKGSLSPQQQWGNKLACYLIKKIWGYTYSDLGPFRAITIDALRKLSMNDTTFGWTVEMQIKALQHHLLITEIPVTNFRRIGKSKISGTIKGTIGAGIGILSMIYTCWRHEKVHSHTL